MNGEVSKSIEEYRTKKSKFINNIIQEGKPIKGKYLGSEIVEDRFNEGEETIHWKFEVNGMEKLLNNGSDYFIAQMENVSIGSVLTISATGTGNAKRFKVEEKVSE